MSTSYRRALPISRLCSWYAFVFFHAFWDYLRRAGDAGSHADSLTSPIPPLIYADDCQLNGGLNEVGEDGRVALEEKTNSPTSATSVDAAFERSERSPTGGLEAQSW